MRSDYALTSQIPVEQVNIGFKQDYEYNVILLYKTGEFNIHRINGTIFTEQNGIGRYLAGDLSVWYSKWSSSDPPQQVCNIVNSGIPGLRFSFCKCTYNGESWVALKLATVQAVNIYFIGTYLNISWKMIKYYNEHTQEVLNSEINSSIEDFSSDILRYDSTYYATLNDIPNHVQSADKLENLWTNTQSWDTQRYSGVYTMCSNTSDGVSVPSGSPGRYWSGLNIGTDYTQFQVATYGGGTDAAQFSFRRQSDDGGNEDWTPWYEMFCGIRKQENLTLPTDGSGIQIATAKEVETFKWILLDLNKYQDGIGDCHIMTISLSEKYNKTVMVPYYGSPAFIYMQLDFNDSGLYASISSGSGTFRIKGMTIFK